MTAACIVQARMGSTRLPGKVLEALGGRSVLAHVLERCAAIPGIDIVCCAVPEGADSDPVAAEAAAAGAVVVRGPEADVLARYQLAAAALGADVVMRVTSDCPLIDPAVCGAVLRLLRRNEIDYACNNMPPTWPHGLDCEAFPRTWLERAAREAADPYEREHVSPFIRSHADVHKANLPAPRTDLAHHRWTLDTADDLAFLRAVFDRLPGSRAGWDYRAVLAVVAREPALMALNRAHVDPARAARPAGGD